MNTTSTEQKIIKLTAGTQVKTPYDEYQPVIEIGTVSDFHKDGMYYDDNGACDFENKRPFSIEPWKKREANCGRDWKKNYVWANRRAACLTANYPGKAAEMERKRQAYEDAVVLDDGDIVEVDGMLFEVFCIKRIVSDQIHFTYIGEAA